MSYLLRNRTATNPLGGWNHNKGSRFLPPNRASTAGMYRLSAGGAQVQVQRQPQTLQQKPAPQQQQQRVAGVISMEEVLADLRILESQQQESERKLHHARITKQRRLEQQAALEEKLDKLKYQNGQQRADLQRAHDLLSEGQRQLSLARTAAAKAGDDLHEFDRKLKVALEIKFSLVIHQQTQDRLVEALHKKVAAVVHMKQGSEQRLNKAKHDLQNANQLDEKIRLEISNELVRHQRIDDQTAKADAELLKLAENLELCNKEEAALKLRIEEIEKEANMLKIQEVKNEEKFKSRDEEHRKFMQEAAAEHDCHKKLIMEKTSLLRQFWHETASVQKSEGHTPSQLPSESICPPVLDVARIRDSLNAEVVAISDEVMAKEQLSDSVEELEKKSAILRQQLDTSSSSLAEMQANNLKQLQAEKEVQASNAELLAKYESICKSVDEKMQMKRQNLSAQSGEVVELQQSLDSLSHEIREANCFYKSHRESLSGIDDDIIDIKAERDEVKNANQQTLSQLEGELAKIRCKVEELHRVAKVDNPEVSTNEMSSEDRNLRKQVDKAEKKISHFVKVYPEIEKISIQYRPDLSDQEQARIDLKPFVKKWQKSILSLDTKIDDLEKVEEQKRGDQVGSEEASTIINKSKSTKNKVTDIRGSGGKTDRESTAKPRSLLSSFLRENDKNFGMSENVVVIDHPDPASAKKVRWDQDYGVSDELETVEFGTQTAVEMVKGSAKRKVFGSKRFVGQNELLGANAKERSVSSRSLVVTSASLSTFTKSIAQDRVVDKRSFTENKHSSESLSKSDSKRRRVSSTDHSNDTFANQTRSLTISKPKSLLSTATAKSEQKSSHKLDSYHDEAKSMKRSVTGENEGSAFFTTKSSHASRKIVSSERDESKSRKKGVSSTQFSGISSQERPSKGRRRKRVSTGASVGSKPGRASYMEEEYSFNFTN